MKDVADAWDHSITWANKNEVDLIVQAGDVFEHPNIHGRQASVGTLYDAFVSPFKSQQVPTKMFVIPGNHDMSGARDMDTLAPFVRHPWITVSRKPEVVEINDELAICSMPWVNRAHLHARLMKKGETQAESIDKVNKALSNLTKNLAAKVKECKDKGLFVLFVGHLEVTGSKMRDGQLQTGGSFEFSGQSLADIGCDAYALAHIHVRQHINGLPNDNDGYLGPLCQLEFDGLDKEVGCRLIDIDGRTITQDKFLDNFVSPRYFTVETLEGLDYRPDVDYVKLRGEQRPESLPARVIFESTKQAEATRRTSEHLDAGTSVQKLLTVWKDFANCEIPIDKLVSRADELISTCLLPADAIGSLERIDRIFLNNITCHARTEIDLRGVTGVIAIEGPNGSGKTTAIEAMPLSLWGESPSRKHLPSLLPQDKNGKGVIEVDFVSDGKKYMARREFNKTPKTFGHKAYVYRDADDKTDPVAGPKGADVDNWATAAVGDVGLINAGIFCSQSESGNLMSLLPSERKDLFSKLLGSEKFLVVGKKAENTASGDNKLIEAHQARAERIKIDLADEEKEHEKLSALKSELTVSQASLEAVNKKLEEAMARVATLDASRKAREKAESDLAKVHAKLSEVKTKGVSLKEQKAKLEASDSKPLEKALAEAKKAKDEYDNVRTELSKKEAKIASLSAKADKHESTSKLLKSERAKQFHEASAKRANSLSSLERSRGIGRRPLAEAVEQKKTELAVAKSDFEQVKKKAELLKGFPDLKECSSCPLAKDGIENRDMIPDLVKSGKNLVSQVKDAEKSLADYDTETKRQIDEMAPHETISLEDFQPEVLKQITDEDNKASEAYKTLLDIQKNKDLENLSESLSVKVATIPSLESKIAACSDDKIRAAKLETQIEALRDEFKSLSKEIETFELPPKVDDAAEKAKVATLSGESTSCQGAINNWTREIGRTEANLEAHSKRHKELSSLQDVIKEKLETIAVDNALSKAFSRDGIPQLIVDSAIPHFQDIMADLARDFGGKWSIQVSSHKEVNNGASVKEQIDIFVDDGHGLRDISTYSGGEKRLLRNVIRIAFALLQAERSGKGLKVLVLDEATENMDNAHVDTFMRMLARLSASFNQVFVISHNDYVLSALPNRMVFSRSTWPSESTSVETSFSLVNKGE